MCGWQTMVREKSIYSVVVMLIKPALYKVPLIWKEANQIQSMFWFTEEMVQDLQIKFQYINKN